MEKSVIFSLNSKAGAAAIFSDIQTPDSVMYVRNEPDKCHSGKRNIFTIWDIFPDCISRTWFQLATDSLVKGSVSHSEE